MVALDAARHHAACVSRGTRGFVSRRFTVAFCAQDVAQATAQKEEQEQARADMLMRLLSADAKERLNRIALVKPDKVTSLVTASPLRLAFAFRLCISPLRLAFAHILWVGGWVMSLKWVRPAELDSRRH